MGPVDLAIAAAILAGASWLLYGTFVKRGGACAGCSQRGDCATPRPGLVKLGARGAASSRRVSGRPG
jgi:hypothetical protein